MSTMQSLQRMPAVRVARPAARPAAATATGWKMRESAFVWSGYLVLHAALAIASARSATVATIYAAFTLALALAVSAIGSRPELALYALGYVVGAEVLWRMTNAAIPWETAKYTVVAIAVIAIVRSGRLRLPARAFTYFALLLPSALVTIATVDFYTWRRDLSGNLSGPLCMVVCIWYFSRVRVTTDRLRTLGLTMAGPILGTAAIATYVLATTEITFGLGSNVEASGGFGPNQVSGALGLGALACFLVLVLSRSGILLRVVMLAVLLYLTAQAALTFSRGGLYMTVAAVAGSAVFLAKDSKTRVKLLVGGVAAVALFALLILPRLDTFTNGALSNRLSTVDPTNRDAIVRSDVHLFVDHPILGVGPGRSGDARKVYLESGAPAHTEFTRLLAEHGIFGMMALCMLALEGLARLRQAKGDQARALVVAFFIFGLAYMAGYAMRTAAPAFAIGLACALWAAAAPTEEPRRARAAAAKKVEA